ncbi:wd and tetratricopeptide repeat protein [Drechmeria coniospora]|uniref:Wd and tetratricopeptide repeat protein n=1 Tax=Drechmeria coniospora TaxID=98403 RepID=A0A151GLA4_DRECN|nr:wd and tetratricopeptide repeat protein [Drechmeria coniospora]KYK57782.1 wd and tetratricopeptide repeat protein [Drechmeria coniospora]
MDRNERLERLLERRSQLTRGLVGLPYDLILYLERAVVHSDLGYPDLAAGDAYRALLLADEVVNEGFEYHEQALECLMMHSVVPMPNVLASSGPTNDSSGDNSGGDPSHDEDRARTLATTASIRAYQILSLSLLRCGCLQSAANFCDRGLQIAPKNQELLRTREHVRTAGSQKLGRSDFVNNQLPDYGLVRREIYPWNDHEPDRFAPTVLEALNERFKQLAPKCAIQAATLPVLLEGAGETDRGDIVSTCQQLGVFAREDIAPGETVLSEFTLLTANNRLKDPICDACGSDLPPLGGESEAVNCDECYDTVFCSQHCHDEAMERYHPAVCEKDVDTIAKDPDAVEADETLYLLLLARVLALAAHQESHPLDLDEVNFIWGDFVSAGPGESNLSPAAGPPPEWTLPFSFKYNIETPLHVLEKMDVDIYAQLAEYDVWVLNTLYAKFRGTASARKNPRDGRPDVAAVHPFWCLANHDCDPGVTWDWGGRMVLRAREERVVGNRPGGIKRGEEILNHYCDVSLPVQQRREWARGSLGGWCMCQRCRTEAAATGEELAADET